MVAPPQVNPDHDLPAQRAHLQRALRAAATARARTARIRAGRLACEAAEDSRPPPSASANPAIAQRAPPPAPDAGRQRFARTVAIALEMRQAGASEWPDEPWHLRVRDDLQRPPGDGWLERLLRPLRAGARPARARSAAPAPALPQTADRPAMVREASAEVAADTGRERLRQTPSARASPPPAGSEPAHALRLSPVRRWQPDAQAPRVVLPKRVGGLSGVEPDWRRAARWRPQLADLAALYRRAVPATAMDSAPPRKGSRPIAAPAVLATNRSLVPWDGGRVPTSRLRLALAQAPPAKAGRHRVPTAAARSAAAAPPRAAPAAWLVAIGCAVVGGFALGVLANGAAVVSGPSPAHDVRSERAANDAPPAALHGAAGGLSVGVRDPYDRAEVAVIAEAKRAANLPSASGLTARAHNRAAVEGASDPAQSTRASADGPAMLAADATSWDVLYAQGHRLQLEGNLVAATDAYRRASRLNPDHPAILYDLGYVLQMQGRDDAAIDSYRRTIERQPEHGYAHHNLGYLLQRRGDTEDALAHYAIAATKQPGNPYIYYDWASSLERLGAVADAIDLYWKAIEIDPHRQPAVDARRRLAALGTPPGR